MALLTRVPEPNIWDVICKEFAAKESSFVDDTESVASEHIDYNPAIHNPVFYGKRHAKVHIDDIDPDFDAAISHPAAVGFAFVDKPDKLPPPPAPTPPNHKTCSPREYLEHYIFPILLPALEEMLKQAKEERCFERRRTKFNALDFITEYLYTNNPSFDDRNGMILWDIDFVKNWLKDHPRPPLPLSLLLSEEEAALLVQSHWKGYLVRKQPDIQELRVWQKEWKEINSNIRNKVDGFWAEAMPEADVEISVNNSEADGVEQAAEINQSSSVDDAENLEESGMKQETEKIE
ncbi:IQ domain-containing protein K-like [Tubulanus polymorphus]|uniref:IQ domain-containing protein K-like n=1 Tax=Tubulanus polymorphus TaxID=672921 RepID=UPI003DA2D617